MVLQYFLFPCDQFGNQNPEDGVQTAAQCKLHFGVTYPVFDKINVNGDNTHPLFNYLKHEIDSRKSKEIRFNKKCYLKISKSIIQNI